MVPSPGRVRGLPGLRARVWWPAKRQNAGVYWNGRPGKPRTTTHYQPGRVGFLYIWFYNIKVNTSVPVCPNPDPIILESSAAAVPASLLLCHSIAITLLVHYIGVETGKRPSQPGNLHIGYPYDIRGLIHGRGDFLRKVITMRMLSHIASNMLGSVGGITYLNNPFHQIVARQRTVPVQPNTNNQVYAKNAFTAAVQAWEAASEAYRDGWAAYAATVTFTGPLGDYHPSGRMLAIAQYQISSYLESQIPWVVPGGNSMEPPVEPGMLVVLNPKITAPGPGHTGFSLEVTNNNGEAVSFHASRSFKQSDARNFFKGPFLTSSIQRLACPDADSVEIEWYNLDDVSIYFVKGRFISNEPPRRYSQQFILRAISETVIG